jgi:hypothetical protein
LYRSTPDAPAQPDKKQRTHKESQSKLACDHLEIITVPMPLKALG